MLTDTELKEYIAALTQDQAEAIQAIRRLVVRQNPTLEEQVDAGKWYTGLLVYSAPGLGTLFALGPRPKGFTTFHMMPYYGSTALQQRHGAALKRFLTGKSCIKFKRYADLPEDALRDITGRAAEVVTTALEGAKAPKSKVRQE